MKTRAAAFLTVFALSVASFPVVYLVSNAQKNDLAALVDVCVSEMGNSPPVNSGPWNKYAGILDDFQCNRDGVRYKVKEENRTPTQRMIAESKTGIEIVDFWATCSAMLLLVTAIPFAWAFLLNRIRELSKALRGLS